MTAKHLIERILIMAILNVTTNKPLAKAPERRKS